MKNIKDKIKKIVMCILKNIVYLIFRYPKEEKVILVKLDAVGDFILWLDAAKKIREFYNDKKILLICTKSNALIAKKVLNYDELIVFNTNDLHLSYNYGINFIKSILRLSKINGEILIMPVYSFTKEMLEIVYCINAKIKISIDGDKSNITEKNYNYSKKLYSNIINTPQENLHELDRNIFFVNQLMGTNYKAHIFRMPLLVQKENNQEQYFVVAPGGSDLKKSWEIERYAELVLRIKENTSLECFLCGGSDEIELGNFFLVRGIKCINYIGKTTLIEYIELIRNATFLVGNDSSGIHISATVNTPSVCILVGTQYGRFHPYNKNEDEENCNYPILIEKKMKCFGCLINNFEKRKYTIQCLESVENSKKLKCIRDISVDEVWEKIAEILYKMQDKLY